MTNITKFAMALVIVLGAILAVAASGSKHQSSAALPFATKPGSETPVRATKSDRLRTGSEIRRIAGVTIVMRDLDRTAH